MLMLGKPRQPQALRPPCWALALPAVKERKAKQRGQRGGSEKGRGGEREGGGRGEEREGEGRIGDDKFQTRVVKTVAGFPC